MSKERSAGSGHSDAGSASMINTVPRSRTRSTSRRAAPWDARDGGRTIKQIHPVEQVGRRLGPRAARAWHEEHATKVHAEVSDRDDAGVVHAHDRSPVTARARLGEETERQTEPAQSRLRLHDDARTTPQSPVGNERAPGLAKGQYPALGEGDGTQSCDQIRR
jgi:hypothetical protein